MNINAFVAQSVEHLPFKQRVVGSIPTGRTRKITPARVLFLLVAECANSFTHV